MKVHLGEVFIQHFIWLFQDGAVSLLHGLPCLTAHWRSERALNHKKTTKSLKPEFCPSLRPSNAHIFVQKAPVFRPSFYKNEPVWRIGNTVNGIAPLVKRCCHVFFFRQTRSLLSLWLSAGCVARLALLFGLRWQQDQDSLENTIIWQLILTHYTEKGDLYVYHVPRWFTYQASSPSSPRSSTVGGWDLMHSADQ